MTGLKIFITALCVLASQWLAAQHYNLLNAWKLSKHELIGGIGLSNYMGELGGGDGESRPLILDMEFVEFKFAWQIMYRYNMSKRVALRTGFNWFKISGNDQLTQNPQRSYRNLSFKANVFELSGLFDFFILRAKPGHVYHIRGARGSKGQPFDLFAYTGIAAFYFRSKSDGILLQPLGTEGQGLDGGLSKYSPVSFAVPFGLGLNFVYFKNVKIGADLSYRFTFTDYLDDVSTFYYDNNVLREQRGDLTADMADKTDGSIPGWSAHGAPRGNPKTKDHYFAIMFTVTYNLSSLKKAPNRPGGPHSFNKKTSRRKF